MKENLVQSSHPELPRRRRIIIKQQKGGVLFFNPSNAGPDDNNNNNNNNVSITFVKDEGRNDMMQHLFFLIIGA